MEKILIGPEIKKVNEEIEKRVNEQNRVFHLTLAQGMVVIYLSQQEDLTAPQSDLISLLHVAHTTMIAMLRSMERKGMVRISKDPDDRRSNLVTLLWGGPSEYRQLVANSEDNESTILKGFSSKEKKLFAEFLGRAYDNLRQNPPGRPVTGDANDEGGQGEPDEPTAR